MAKTGIIKVVGVTLRTSITHYYPFCLRWQKNIKEIGEVSSGIIVPDYWLFSLASLFFASSTSGMPRKWGQNSSIRRFVCKFV